MTVWVYISVYIQLHAHQKSTGTHTTNLDITAPKQKPHQANDTKCGKKASDNLAKKKKGKKMSTY